MAHPSSSHRDGERDTTTHRAHRTSSSQHHHHRTISSTTLLLVLSLILAVLAVMLSLPSRHTSILPSMASITASSSPSPNEHAHGVASSDSDHAGTSAGFWGYLTPKRSHSLVSRESNVALREAEVARREAELLVGAPGGIVGGSCAPCPAIVEEYHNEPQIQYVTHTVAAPAPPASTVIQEVVKTVEVTATPDWVNARVESIVDREVKIADREKEVGKREDVLGKRESDATKREAWIMEQLVALSPERVEEEIVYENEHPRHLYSEARRPPPKHMPINKDAHAETIIHHVRPQPTVQPIIVEEVPVTTSAPLPAHTRGPAHPTPETFITTSTGSGARPTREVFVEVEQPTMVPLEPRAKVGGPRKVHQAKVVPKPKVPSWMQGPVVEEEEIETVIEKVTRGRGFPTPPPPPEGAGARTHRRWFGAEW